MSKLDELIQQYCPNGVEYKTLGEVCEIGKGVQFNKENMSDEGSYPVINGGINPSGYIEQYNQNENTITISQGGASAGYVNWIDKKFWAGAHCYVLKPNETTVQNRYVFHFIKSKEYRLQECQYGAGIPALAKSTVAELEIPIPPLPVQEEIVRILDKFTSLTAELTAELTARRKQYEYYRDALLTKETKVEIKKLGEIAEIGVGNKPEQILEEKTKYEYINAGTTNSGYTVTSNCKGDTVTTPSRGQGGIGFVGYQKNDFYLGPLCYKIRSLDTKLVLNKYIFYYLQSNNEQILKIKNSGGVPSVNRADLINITISLPPLDVQQRIVNVLDNFDAICSDLKIGLPAEIDARKKQYEYYRDLLLTFAERGNTIFTDQIRSDQIRSDQMK